MERIFELYNKTSLALVDQIQIVNDPKIREELNGGYTLDFDIDYRDRYKLNNNVLIKADGQFFQIARIVKSRYETITLSVAAEHVSYEMIVEGTLEEAIEYEDTAHGTMSQILQGTRFTVGSVIDTRIEYYYSNNLDRRKRLFDVANLFGGELVFDNFIVSLVRRRGSDKGLDISLGVNLRGVTEEQNFIEGRTSYELDLVDLSKIPGYGQEFSEVEIGDTISIIDNKLGIDTNERILSIEYNPFQKALPSVAVGAYARDFTEYIKDEDEDEDEEDETQDKNIKSFLSEFKVGKVDVLKHGTDDRFTIESWVSGEDKYARSGSTYKLRRQNELKGLSIVIRSEYSSYYHYLINTKQGDNKTSSVLMDLKNLGGINLNDIEVPGNENDSFIVFISERSIEELQNNPLLLEDNKYGAFGIEFNISNANGGQHLYKFDVGGESRLSSLSDEFEEAVKFVKGEINRIIPTGEYLLKPLDKEKITETSGRFESFVGLDAELLEEYKDLNYYFYIVVNTMGESGDNIIHVHDWKNPDPGAKDWKIPLEQAESYTCIISEYSWDELRADDELFYNSDFGAYGIIFKPDIKPDDALNFFTRFYLEDNDLMSELTLQNENVVKAIAEDRPPTLPENTFEISENQVGLFIEKAEEYGGNYLYLVDFKIPDGAQYENEIVPEIVHYTDEQWTWNWTATYKKRGIIIFMTKIPVENINITNISENFICSFGVTIVLNGDLKKSDADKYFDEFRIGDVDMIPLVSDETNAAYNYYDNQETFKAVSKYVVSEHNTMTGLFVTLKPEYANKHLVLLDLHVEKGGNGHMYSDTYEDNVTMYGAHTMEILDGELLFSSFTLAIFESDPNSLSDGQTIDDVLIAAFGITVELEGEGIGGQQIILEYGSFPVSDIMSFQFEKGPYTEIASITTGFSASDQWSIPSQLSTEVIFYPVYDWGEIVGLQGTSNATVDGLLINLQVVCIKGELDTSPQIDKSN